MAKFKVGDRVKATGDLPKGRIGTVSRQSKSAPNNLVAFDGWLDGHDGDSDFATDCGWWLGDDELSPVIAPAITAPSAPATTSAIRTVTRREIVPGYYGKVRVTHFAGGAPSIVMMSTNRPSDLRAAASLFSELADVLDENAGEGV